MSKISKQVKFLKKNCFYNFNMSLNYDLIVISKFNYIVMSYDSNVNFNIYSRKNKDVRKYHQVDPGVRNVAALSRGE